MSDSEVPKGWMVMEEWVPMTYHHELMYQPYVWTTRAVKKHWWSLSEHRTGWFPYGTPFPTYAAAVEFARRTQEAMQK